MSTVFHRQKKLRFKLPVRRSLSRRYDHLVISVVVGAGTSSSSRLAALPILTEPFPKKRLAKSQEAKSQGQDRCKDRLELERADSGLMPRRGHSSERRAGSGQLDSESSSESDSEAGQRRRAPPRPPIVRRAPARVAAAVDPRVCCPGCCRVFASLDILKKHRNAPRLANAACHAWLQLVLISDHDHSGPPVTLIMMVTPRVTRETKLLG